MRLGLLIVGMLLAVNADPAGAAPARIAFSSGDDLYTMQADGSAVSRLTTLGPASSAIEPAWSPDGTRIAFTRAREVGANRIWVVGSDGADPRPLTPRLPRNSTEHAPVWSPDGAHLTFARDTFRRESLISSILVVDADGSHERTLSSQHRKSLSFIAPTAWSPDGAAVLFTRTALDRRSYFRPSLFTIPAGGGEERLLARDAGAGAYSPDGARIAFLSVRDRNGHDCGSDECWYHAELYAMAADGSRLTRLTRTKASEEPPAWSPDGGRIAFASDRNYPAGENPEVYSVAPDGSCLTWLTNGSLASRSPSWEPGASLSSDPGACGDAGRPPLLGVDPGAALAGSHFSFTPYWLGQTFGPSLLLSDSSTDNNGGRGLDLSYSDCSSFDPAGCPQPVQIFQGSTCAEHPLLEHYRAVRRLRTVAGLLVYRGIGRNFDVFAGTTAINVYGAPQRSLRRLVGSLRPVGTDAPASRLPPPSFGHNVWARLDRAASAHRRSGSVAATARELHLRPQVVRRRLELRKRLLAAGAGRRHCAPGDRPR
jgi:hypothetical protein